MIASRFVCFLQMLTALKWVHYLQQVVCRFSADHPIIKMASAAQRDISAQIFRHHGRMLIIASSIV
jgi:hypothetical protein